MGKVDDAESERSVESGRSAGSERLKVDIRLKLDILLEMLTVRQKVDDPNLEHLPFGILDRPFSSFGVQTLDRSLSPGRTFHFHPDSTKSARSISLNIHES